MRVTINTETRALLWFALTNGLAHFYFTMLPYLIYDDVKINQMTTIMSFSLICLWLYGVRARSSMVLILLIPLLWLLNAGVIIGDHPQAFNVYPDEAINLNSDESLLSDRLSWVETLVSGLCMAAYLRSGLMWLAVADGKNTDRSSLSRLASSQVDHVDRSPRGWPGLVIIYWAIASPMSVHYWSRWSVVPDPLTDLKDQVMWIKALWFLSFTVIVISASTVLFRIAPPMDLSLERLQLVKIDRSWRRKAWGVSLIGVALIFIEIFIIKR